ncbi:MAG: ABC transporter substrate-binding protein [Acidimicrobiales bacterium]
MLHTTRRARLALLTSVATCLPGIAIGASAGLAAASPSIVIKAVLPPNTGPITASDNAGLRKVTKEYEKAHSNVTVDWLPENTSSITQANATVESQASGGAAPDLVWEQYGPVTSGSIPAGLLQNIKPYLEKRNPYVPGNKSWLSLFPSSVVPYMTSPNGHIDIILGSAVETGMFYNKADFAKARIGSAPKTWAQFMGDLAKLKAAGFQPFVFADGGLCNPSWFERLATSSLLANEVKKFDVNHAEVTTGLDDAVAIKKGIISMNNPRYAEVWKLLGQLDQYQYSGAATYDACSADTATTAPLDSMSLLTEGKVAIVWGGSWYIPDLNSLGWAGKYGVFPEPTITSSTTKDALDTVTRGVIGGPNGNGQWGVTSKKADHTMTPAKTAVIMNFLAWLFKPANLGYWINQSQKGGEIPVEKGAPLLNLPGLKSLVPTGKVPTVIDVVLDDVLTTAATTSGLRLVQDYLDGSLSYSAFASQWQSLLTSAATAWASANHVNLSKY